MPIGILIIFLIIALIFVMALLLKLDPDVMNKIEVILIISVVVFSCGTLIYIVILSFFDNAAAIKLFKELIQTLR
jgi:hypothetical protein